MNQAQMEMLSVKSAIERTVAGLFSTYASLYTTPSERANKLTQAASQYTASLYASGQIESACVTLEEKQLSIAFSAGGHTSAVSFLLPTAFISKATPTRREDPLPSVEHISFDDSPAVSENCTQETYASRGDTSCDPVEAYERAKKLIL